MPVDSKGTFSLIILKMDISLKMTCTPVYLKMLIYDG